jgi:hypothetical protein
VQELEEGAGAVDGSAGDVLLAADEELDEEADVEDLVDVPAADLEIED